MAIKLINVGAGELTGDGESLRSAFIKINDNFNELYSSSNTSIFDQDLNTFNSPNFVNLALLGTEGSATLVSITDELNVVSSGTVVLRTNSSATEHSWSFGIDETLTFPNGSVLDGSSVYVPLETNSSYDITTVFDLSGGEGGPYVPLSFKVQGNHIVLPNGNGFIYAGDGVWALDSANAQFTFPNGSRFTYSDQNSNLANTGSIRLDIIKIDPNHNDPDFSISLYNNSSTYSWIFSNTGTLALPSLGNIKFGDNTIQETASPYLITTAAGYSVNIDDNVSFTGFGANGADATQVVVNFGPDEYNITAFNIQILATGTITESAGGVSVYKVSLTTGTASTTLQGWAITPTEFVTQQDPTGAIFHYLGEIVSITDDDFQFSQVILDTSFPEGTEIRLFNTDGTLYLPPEEGMTIQWANNIETEVVNVLVPGSSIYNTDPIVTFITAESQIGLPFPITIKTNNFQEDSKILTIDQTTGFKIASTAGINYIESNNNFELSSNNITFNVGEGFDFEVNVYDGNIYSTLKYNKSGFLSTDGPIECEDITAFGVIAATGIKPISVISNILQIGNNDVTNEEIIDIVSQRIRIRSAVPNSSTGSIDDQIGNIAFDSNYIYYCIANYTGSSTINWSNVNEFSGGEHYIQAEISDPLLLNGVLSITNIIVNGGEPSTELVTSYELISGNTYKFFLGNTAEVWNSLQSSTLEVIPNIWKRVSWSSDAW